MSRYNFPHFTISLFMNVVQGISFKTQALYVGVFVARYLDLFTGDFVSIYNTVMKLFFIGSSGYILYLMKVRYKCVYDLAMLCYAHNVYSCIQANERPFYRHLPSRILAWTVCTPGSPNQL